MRLVSHHLFQRTDSLQQQAIIFVFGICDCHAPALMRLVMFLRVECIIAVTLSWTATLDRRCVILNHVSHLLLGLNWANVNVLSSFTMVASNNGLHVVSKAQRSHHHQCCWLSKLMPSYAASLFNTNIARYCSKLCCIIIWRRYRHCFSVEKSEVFMKRPFVL